MNKDQPTTYYTSSGKSVVLPPDTWATGAADPDEWQDEALAKLHRPDPVMDAMLAREIAEPGCLRREGLLPEPVLGNLAYYRDFKEAADRHHARNHSGGPR